MFPGNLYTIYEAAPDHDWIIERLAALDNQRTLTGRVLIGEIDGIPAAAVSLADGRLAADPFIYTSRLRPVLRMRARALLAGEQTPSVRDRILANLQFVRPAADAA